MSDSQITVKELIAQLQECPPDALVDVDVEDSCHCGASYPEFKVASDENLECLIGTNYNKGTSWVTLRGFR